MPLSNTRFTTKIQYNTFETGEFVEEKKRNYNEVIELIESFPWEQQRHNIAIDLTCPSITIQDDNSNYLKLALYYNGKFVLYFFDGKNLFSKSFYKYAEAYDYIKECFETFSIDYTQYKKQNILLKNILIHFKSNDFIYYVDPRKPLKGLSRISKFFLVLCLILFTYYIFKLTPDIAAIISLSLLSILCLLFVGGIELILTLNYFSYSKGKILQLSKGADSFKYGETNNLRSYKKSEINEIFVIEDSSRYGPTHSITFLYMKTGDVIKITSLHLFGRDIGCKMPGIIIKTKKVFIPYFKSKEK